MLTEFSCSCVANELEARRCICDVLSTLVSAGLLTKQAQDVELVLAEALNNIVEHAYVERRDGTVFLQAHLMPDSLTIRLRDTGRPLPFGRIPKTKLVEPSKELGILPEGGFGWFLIHSLTSAVQYERQNGTNHLSLFFRLAPENTPRPLEKKQLP